MVQVIGPGTPKGPSVGQRLSTGLGQALESGQRLYEKSQRDKAMKQAGFGDLLGLDPDLQKLAVSERLKQQGKQQLLSQKQDFLNQVLGGQGQSQGQGMGDMLAQGDEMQPEGQRMPQGFDPTQIPDEVIARASAMDPNLGRSLQHAKDVALREKSSKQKRSFEREKFSEEQRKSSPEYRREQQLESSLAQADVKYNQELQETSKQHKLKEQTLDRLEALNRKGVTGKPYEKLLEKAGLVALTSDGRREFAADVKNLITDIRSILGGQFSNFEFQTILNAYPSADFSKGANEAIIKNLKAFQDIKSKEVDFAEQMKKENKGKVPMDFQARVNERVREYAASKSNEIKENTKKIMNSEYGIPEGNVLMFDPQGEPLNVSPKEVEMYESLGATLP